MESSAVGVVEAAGESVGRGHVAELAREVVGAAAVGEEHAAAVAVRAAAQAPAAAGGEEEDDEAEEVEEDRDDGLALRPAALAARALLSTSTRLSLAPADEGNAG